ncbi:MAG: transcriptional regulator [Candidatus Methanofastidiosia archaeon]
MGIEKETLILKTEKIFKKAGFETSICHLRSCYDVISRGKSMIFLIKVIANIDSLQNEYIHDLKSLCYYFKAHPLIIGIKTKNEVLHPGVVYSREDIPAVSIETLEQMVIENSPPLIYADRGGLYVRIEGDALKKIREDMGFSLSEFASEIGISRSTLYEYEHSKRGIELYTAFKIESIVDAPLIKPIDLVKKIKKQTCIYPKTPKSIFEKDVLEHFASIGFTVFPTERTPFDAVVGEEKEKSKIVILTGISNMDLRNLRKRITIVHDLSEILEKDAIFILKSQKAQRTIEGVPIVFKEEFKNISDIDSMIEIIRRKKEITEENKG